MELDKSSIILDLKTVKSLGGSYYIEIMQGLYSISSNIWSESSIYIDGDIWLKFFEPMSEEVIEDYDFYSFNHIFSKDCQNFANHFFKLSQMVQQCNTLDDLSKNDFLSSSGKPYIDLTNGIIEPFFIDDTSSVQLFQRGFAHNIAVLSQAYLQFASWIQDNGKKGVSILGI